eukprot:TRINITY_DN20173_c0_g1_i1.p1 TRINITY_DN20173_c0_g1~~TRINITY_DN20173_c0_g1_i1.p1  ORF type:complete len:182 (+),score=33.24 TRINITY_DN20173_c0_g1_i1:63-608(+)
MANGRDQITFVGLVVVGIFLVVAMATHDWYVLEQSNTTFSYGLIEYKVESGSYTSTGDLWDEDVCGTDCCKDMRDAGVGALLLSIIALCFLVATLFYVTVSFFGRPAELKRRFVLSLLSATFCFLAVIVYDAAKCEALENSDFEYGFSFAFVAVAGCMMVVFSTGLRLIDCGSSSERLNLK